MGSPKPTSTAVASVRRFNRFYTRQIGILREGLLKSPFSLAELRVLYEVASRREPRAADLGKDLGLDAGYLSRILRGFTARGFLVRRPSPADGREMLLSLTRRGREAFARLNARQSDEVASMLRQLSPAGQQGLVRAMEAIEQTLDPASAGRPDKAPYLLRLHQPGDMGWIVHRHGVLYSDEYRYDEHFEALVAEIVAHFIRHYDSRRERCWMAEKDGHIVGSVLLVKKSAIAAQLRLLLVEPSARGRGIGKRLVAECIRFARQAGYRSVILWTQSELEAARRVYQQAGFRLAGRKPHQSWGRDNLIAETWKLKLPAPAGRRFLGRGITVARACRAPGNDRSPLPATRPWPFCDNLLKSPRGSRRNSAS
jgi:DNA-binding MarR family transcriptional regulator/GNAT superfamily N-acetyltransferase